MIAPHYAKHYLKEATATFLLKVYLAYDASDIRYTTSFFFLVSLEI